MVDLLQEWFNPKTYYAPTMVPIDHPWEQSEDEPDISLTFGCYGDPIEWAISLCRAPVVVLSCPPPERGGPLYLEDWASIFAEQGYTVVDAIRPLIWDLEVSSEMKQDVLLFVKEVPEVLKEAALWTRPDWLTMTWGRGPVTYKEGLSLLVVGDGDYKKTLQSAQDLVDEIILIGSSIEDLGDIIYRQGSRSLGIGLGRRRWMLYMKSGEVLTDFMKNELDKYIDAKFLSGWRMDLGEDYELRLFRRDRALAQSTNPLDPIRLAGAIGMMIEGNSGST